MVRCSTTSQVAMAATVAFQLSSTSKQTSARSKQPLCIFPESDYAAFQSEMLLFPVLSEASDASPLALWFNTNASWLICYFSKLGGLKILLGRLGGPMLNNCAAGGEENVVLHPQVWPGVSAPTPCLPPSVATGCTSVRIMAFLEQVNGPLTPHQSLAWLIRQRNQSPPLPSIAARQSRWCRRKAESGENQRWASEAPHSSSLQLRWWHVYRLRALDAVPPQESTHGRKHSPQSATFTAPLTEES